MFRENCAAGTIQQLMNPKGAVTGMTTEYDRMTREQAEQAQQTFEFPGWLCLGIVDLTATDGSWALKIAPDNNPADFRYYTSVSQWIHECRLDDYSAPLAAISQHRQHFPPLLHSILPLTIRGVHCTAEWVRDSWTAQIAKPLAICLPCGSREWLGTFFCPVAILSYTLYEPPELLDDLACFPCGLEVISAHTMPNVGVGNEPQTTPMSKHFRGSGLCTGTRASLLKADRKHVSTSPTVFCDRSMALGAKTSRSLTEWCALYRCCASQLSP